MEAKQLALVIAQVALDKQAESLEILDVGEKVDYAAYVVICSGRSERHVDALVTSIEGFLREKKVYPLGIEGRQANRWILLDYNEVVLHVFEKDTRGFYDLDSLWIDAERIPLHKAASAE